MTGRRRITTTGEQVGTRRARVGVLWRGEPGALRPREDRGLGPLFDAFTSLGADVVPVPFADDRVDEVRARLRGLEGVLVWVNPIQDGATRQHVDELLWEASANGTWVSAHPAVIAKIGTKEVLFATRHLGWGSDTELYRSGDELAERLPARLTGHGRLVVKQARGNGGEGVWSVELLQPAQPVTMRSLVAVREARVAEETADHVTIEEFVQRCKPYFDWSGVLIDQEYQHRLADGMIRCYLSHDKVVGFCQQWPRGLFDTASVAAPPPRGPKVMEGPDTPAFQLLRRRAEVEWVPEMARVVGTDVRSLPVIWDADFLYGTRSDGGEDRYVLCEINVSAVWPFPPMATTVIAANTLARISELAERPRDA